MSIREGELLRIVDGRGIDLRIMSGVVWLTEESSYRDVVLRAGDAYRIAAHGVTLLEAHARARMVLEFAPPHKTRAGFRFEVVPASTERKLASPVPPTQRSIARPSRRIASSLLGWLDRAFDRGTWQTQGGRAWNDGKSRSLLPELTRERLLRSSGVPYL